MGPGSLNVLRNILKSRRLIYNSQVHRRIVSSFSTTVEAASKPDVSNEIEKDQQQDPFGIEEVIRAQTSTVLVQGFYESSPKKEAVSGNGQDDENEKIDKNSRLQKYDGWIKHREQSATAEKFDSPVENTRFSSFGNVRLDSDNVVEQHGQFDEVNPIDRTSLRNQDKYKPYFKPAENSSSERMTAFEFLKKYKEERQKEDQGKDAAEDRARPIRARPIIDKPTSPRKVMMDPSILDKIAANSTDSAYLDSNVIPKVYQLPPYNELTKSDMWNIMRKTIIYQNDFILAINKMAGMPMHSASVDCRHFIIEFLDKLADVGQCEKVYPLHRLDKETTGVLLFSKDVRVAKVIAEKFVQHQITKKYLAVTKLCPHIPEGTIKIPIGEGKAGGSEKFRSVLKPDLRKFEIKTRQGNCREAVTHFTVLKSIKEAAFLEVRPDTGVKHQIRLHLGMGLGCPIVGDHKYSHRDRLAPQRLHPLLLHKLKVKQSKVRELPLHLHCNSMSFTLPEEFTKSSEPIYVHAKVPNYFMHTLKAFGLK